MSNNRKTKISENYLARVPVRSSRIAWSTDDYGIVILEIENYGAVNTLLQKFFHKPRISYIHLDEQGSFIWRFIDGERDITALGVLMYEQFGDDAEPLYPRLAKFFQILESYNLIECKKNMNYFALYDQVWYNSYILL